MKKFILVKQNNLSKKDFYNIEKQILRSVKLCMNVV